MNDIAEDMRKAIEGSIKQLAHIRGCRQVDAAVAVATSYAENLRDSRGTAMEGYWQDMVEITDDIVAEETGSR